jgi:iron-regulated transporter 1
MNRLSTPFKILLGRFLTRSGDQAWDFAVPLTLLKIFPDQIRVAAGYYLAVKFLHVLLMPRLASVIDRKSRIHVAYLGTVLQLAGVLGGAVSLYFLFSINAAATNSVTNIIFSLFVVLGISGLVSSMGSTLMNISVGNDLVPAAIPASQITQFNSRMRQLDLFTEVSSPVVAGLLLIVSHPSIALFGFLLVALWNVISFIPEMLILKSIFKGAPDLLKEKTFTTPTSQLSMLAKLKNGWAAFFRQPVAPAVGAYALLWLSVLSPHGVLLTGYLKDAWKMPEVVVGAFRGLGALFGLLSTVLFPIVVSKFGLIKGSRSFILFQTVLLLLALGFFWIPTQVGQYGFLIFILFSRVGLYGFSLGEMQIRQLGIAAHERGEVNGFADALTGVATLALFTFGTLLPSTSQFSILVTGSVGFVALGAIIFSLWQAPKLN